MFAIHHLSTTQALRDILIFVMQLDPDRNSMGFISVQGFPEKHLKKINESNIDWESHGKCQVFCESHTNPKYSRLKIVNNI